MDIKTSEITKMIQERIKNYQFKYEDPHSGTVISVADGIAIVQGLTDVSLLEVVRFDCGAIGLAFSLEEDYVGVVILNHIAEVRENDRVVRTKEIASVPVGSEFLGRVIDPLGNVLDGKTPVKTKNSAKVEAEAPEIMDRESVNEPLETGILAIDALLPIGKGQRELIIGDRQTGKTALTLSAIINQKNKDVLCIYVAISKKSSDILTIIDKLKTNDALDHTIILTANASTSDAMKYLAPFAGMAHAEFFLHQGKDVLIVFDDLSKHAIAYRGLSLLLRRTPGRQAYPGDIFYLHARLLERAAKLKPELGGGSITALPIVETQLEDLSAYIPTNIISITDGQIFLLTELFNLGIKPAIDFGLSVSRVGSSAQINAIKQTVGDLKLDLAKFKEMEVFARFGGNLDSETTKILERGAKLIDLLKQDEAILIPQWIIGCLLLAIKEDVIAQLSLYQIPQFKSDVIHHLRGLTNQDWVKELIKTNKFSSVIKKKALAEIHHVIKTVTLIN